MRKVYEITDIHETDAWCSAHRHDLIGLQGYLEEKGNYPIKGDKKWIGCIFHATKEFKPTVDSIRGDTKGTFNLFRIKVKFIREENEEATV